MRPKEAYNCKNFEDTFGFGAYCNGYSENKIIRVKL